MHCVCPFCEGLVRSPMVGDMNVRVAQGKPKNWERYPHPWTEKVWGTVDVGLREADRERSEESRMLEG